MSELPGVGLQSTTTKAVLAVGSLTRGTTTYPRAVLTYDQAMDASDVGSNPGIELWRDSTLTLRLERSNDNNGQWDYTIAGAFFVGGNAVVYGTRTGSHGPQLRTWSSSGGSFLAQTAGHPAEILLVEDDFEGDLGKWVVRNVDGSGSWQIDNGDVLGNYGIGCGSPGCNQTQLLLRDDLQPGDINWRAEIDGKLQLAFCCFLGGQMINEARFSLYVSDAEKDIYQVGGQWLGTTTAPATATTVYAGLQRYPWTVVAQSTSTTPTWLPAANQRITLTKIGNTYTVRFNGQVVLTNTHAYSMTPKVGLNAYGAIRMDNFKLYRIN